MRLNLRLLVSGFAIVLAVLAFSLIGGSGAAAQTIGEVGIDADPAGNTATSLGEIETCVSVSPGDSFDIDVFVDAVPAELGLGGFGFNLNYDNAAITVTALEAALLLNANGDSGPLISLSEGTPDSDGSFTVGVADFSGSDPGETGAGVLARITLEASGASGITALTLTAVDLATPAADSIPVDSTGAGQVAVGEECPGPVEFTPESSFTIDSADPASLDPPTAKKCTIGESCKIAASFLIPAGQPLAGVATVIPPSISTTNSGDIPNGVLVGNATFQVTVGLFGGECNIGVAGAFDTFDGALPPEGTSDTVAALSDPDVYPTRIDSDDVLAGVLAIPGAEIVKRTVGVATVPGLAPLEVNTVSVEVPDLPGFGPATLAVSVTGDPTAPEDPDQVFCTPFGASAISLGETADGLRLQECLVAGTQVFAYSFVREDTLETVVQVDLSNSCAGLQGFDAAVTMEKFTQIGTDPAAVERTNTFDTIDNVNRYLRVEATVTNGNEPAVLNVSFFVHLPGEDIGDGRTDCFGDNFDPSLQTGWVPTGGEGEIPDIPARIEIAGSNLISSLITITPFLAPDETVTVTRFLAVNCFDTGGPSLEPIQIITTVQGLRVTSIDPLEIVPIDEDVADEPNNQAQNIIDRDEDNALPDGDSDGVLDADDLCPDQAGFPAGVPPDGCPTVDLGVTAQFTGVIEDFVDPSVHNFNTIAYTITNYGPNATGADLCDGTNGGNALGPGECDSGAPDTDTADLDDAGVKVLLHARANFPCEVRWIPDPLADIDVNMRDTVANDFVNGQFVSTLEYRMININGGQDNDTLFQMAAGDFEGQVRDLRVHCFEPVQDAGVIIEMGVAPDLPQHEKQTSDDPATDPGDTCVDTNGDGTLNATNDDCFEANKFVGAKLINPILDPWNKHLFKIDETTGLPIEGIDVPVAADPANVDPSEEVQFIVEDVVRNNGSGLLPGDATPPTVPDRGIIKKNTFRGAPTPTCTQEGPDMWACDILQQVEGDALGLDIFFSEPIADIKETGVAGWGYMIHPEFGSDTPIAHLSQSPHGANQPSGCESPDDDHVILIDSDHLAFGQFGTEPEITVPKHTTVTVRVTTCEDTSSLSMNAEFIGYEVAGNNFDFAYGDQENHWSVRGCWKTDWVPGEVSDVASISDDCTGTLDEDTNFPLQIGQTKFVGTTEDLAPNEQQSLKKGLLIVCVQEGTFTIEISSVVDQFENSDGDIFDNAALIAANDADLTNNSQLNLFTVRCGAAGQDYDPWLKHLNKLQDGLPIDEDNFELNPSSDTTIQVEDVLRNNSVTTDILTARIANIYTGIPFQCVGDPTGLEFSCFIFQQAFGDAYMLDLKVEDAPSSGNPLRVADVTSVGFDGWSYLIHRTPDPADVSNDGLEYDISGTPDQIDVSSIHGPNQASNCESDDDSLVLLGDSTLLETNVVVTDPVTGKFQHVSVPKHTVLQVDFTLCASLEAGQSVNLSQSFPDHPAWHGDRPDDGVDTVGLELEPAVQGCWDTSGGDVTDVDTLITATDLSANCPAGAGAFTPFESQTPTTAVITASGAPLLNPNEQVSLTKDLTLHCKQPGLYTVAIIAQLFDVGALGLAFDPPLSGDINLDNNSHTNLLTVNCTTVRETTVGDPIVLGPAPVNLSDTAGKYMWVIGFITNDLVPEPLDDPNDGDLPEVVDITLTVTGAPEGCDQSTTKILPPITPLSINEGETKPVLFRVFLECHDPAQPDIYQLTIELEARQADGTPETNPNDNVGTTTKALIIVDPQP